MTRHAIGGAALVALTACAGETIEVGAPQPPREYLTCDELAVAPDLEPLQAIPMPDGALYYRKADVDARDAQIAPYILLIRGNWFSCSNQLGKVRDYVEGVKRGE